MEPIEGISVVKRHLPLLVQVLRLNLSLPPTDQRKVWVQEKLHDGMYSSIVEGRVEVIAHPDVSFRAPKRGTRLRLRERNELEGRPIPAGNHPLFSLVGLIDKATELLLGVVNTDLAHGRTFRSVAAIRQWRYVSSAGSVRMLREVL
jgi:hypothetical protein